MGIADMFRTWAEQWIQRVTSEGIALPRTPEFESGSGLTPEIQAGLPWKAHETARGGPVAPAAAVIKSRPPATGRPAGR